MRMGMRGTAVTAEDFEFLAHKMLLDNGISARVKCLSPATAPDGRVVRLLVVRNIPKTATVVETNDLVLTDEEIDKLKASLDNKVLLTTRISLLSRIVLYRVAIRVVLSPSAIAQPAEITQRLYQFLNPVSETTDSNRNLPLRQKIQISQIYYLLQDTPLERLEMYLERDGTGLSKDKTNLIYELNVNENEVIVSGHHEVAFASA
jgi:hypothetical protein